MHEWNVYLRLDELMYQNITQGVGYDVLKNIDRVSTVFQWRF